MFKSQDRCNSVVVLIGFYMMYHVHCNLLNNIMYYTDTFHAYSLEIHNTIGTSLVFTDKSF